ncbi:XRE family transcriptional regulator [Flavobacterium crocinum]|uniref:XRE family transcriptional regulator n=1 Tax=Flavobacterium crocinum TaxID=2183896 RepID=A0A2S1YNR7_9FLAO|nr:helix-turn-helix transcriptional regulator [Flavobacterium crocinum]AWK05744.1 XRE family transcriptional regulator [Flavobacterium crocinum]
MNIDVGIKLKKLRKSKGLSQEEIADYLDISQSAYARMESGENHSWASHILKISEIFKIEPKELLENENLNSEITLIEKLSNAILTQLSKKITEQYEERIKEQKKTIKELRKQLKKL